MTGERRVGEVRVHHGLAVHRFGGGPEAIWAAVRDFRDAPVAAAEEVEVG